MSEANTHPKDCPDQKAAAADRKRHEAARAERQRRQQILAHAVWLEWYPSPPLNNRTSRRQPLQSLGLNRGPTAGRSIA